MRQIEVQSEAAYGREYEPLVRTVRCGGSESP
jgi:hypothetical protein